jgi:hypothetical protein
MKKHSPLYTRIKKAIDGKFRQLSKDKIDPWQNFNIRKNVKIQKCDGSFINFEGVNFSGSIQSALWASNFIPPFLEQIVLEVVARTFSQCEENKLSPELPMKETSSLLIEHVKKTYHNMAGIDRRLRGEGFPERLAPRSVNNEIKTMSRFIDEHIVSEKELWKSRTNNTEKIAKPSKVEKDKTADSLPSSLSRWSQVTFCVLNDGEMEIQAAGKNFTKDEIFGGKFPPYLFRFLWSITMKGKCFETGSFEGVKSATARRYIQRLNDLLKDRFKINEVPVIYNAKAKQYETHFICESELTQDELTPELNTPAGIPAKNLIKIDR